MAKVDERRLFTHRITLCEIQVRFPRGRRPNVQERAVFYLCGLDEF
jgi:hypothetical protein